MQITREQFELPRNDTAMALLCGVMLVLALLANLMAAAWIASL